VSITAIFVASFAGLLARRIWKRVGPGWDEAGAGATARARFMAAIGMLISLMMLFVILAQWIPVFIYGSCQR
jgi:hypothetical protein